MGGVTAAYSGVHAIYQIALAAHQLGRLDRLDCSLLDSPGKWGGLLARVLGAGALTNRRCPGLPPSLVREFPWPMLRQALRGRWQPERRYDWFADNDWFDRRAASALARSPSRVFVGAETCAEHCLRAARTRGMQTVLDCEQVHPAFVQGLLARAADDLGLPPPGPVDTPPMARRKQAEYDLAGHILVLSEVERRSFLEQGFDGGRLVEIPLWADPALWYPPPPGHPRREGEPLRALFIGSVELRKGIPYLLRAVRQCRPQVELTLVGTRHDAMKPFLEKHAGDYQYVTPRTKPELRAMCWQADVLVLPSLVDAFGFVAMEAMACGLPVIVSDNCGVPVPDPAWRVPIMDADALATRLLLYAGDRGLCREHGSLALDFSRRFTPEVYRQRVGELFAGLLNLN